MTRYLPNKNVTLIRSPVKCNSIFIIYPPKTVMLKRTISREKFTRFFHQTYPSGLTRGTQRGFKILTNFRGVIQP
jgi:hypothetical protein